jgi:hypothetical protein
MLERLPSDPPEAIGADAVPLGPLLASIFHAPMVSVVSAFATNARFSMAELVPGFDPSHSRLISYDALCIAERCSC